MTVEYAPRGLIGLLTPQANTTVEPEFALLMPPGYAWLNARLISDRSTTEARLLEYFEQLPDAIGQFANAPLQALALGCAGVSYLAGLEWEDQVLDGLSRERGIPVLSAATAVVQALHRLAARRIALISPYSGALDADCGPYWEARGFEVVRKVSSARDSSEVFQPIYSLSSRAAQEALDCIDDDDLDAIVMPGTGMPSLRPILERPLHRGAPVLSCMLCLAWAAVAALDQQMDSREGLLAWVQSAHWRVRLGALPGGSP